MEVRTEFTLPVTVTIHTFGRTLDTLVHTFHRCPCMCATTLRHVLQGVGLSSHTSVGHCHDCTSTQTSHRDERDWLAPKSPLVGYTLASLLPAPLLVARSLFLSLPACLLARPASTHPCNVTSVIGSFQYSLRLLPPPCSPCSLPPAPPACLPARCTSTPSMRCKRAKS